MAGPTGLDYTSVLACLRAMQLGRARRDEIFSDVRLMENAALGVMMKKREG